MEYPETEEKILEAHNIYRANPHRYLTMANQWVRDHPQMSGAYFSRHFGWMAIGEPWKALEDMNIAIELEPDWISFVSRGGIHRHLGAYEQALADYGRAEAMMMDAADWEDYGFGLLYQADCHARLGNEEAALACCARLRADFWTPGIRGTPPGGKAQIAAKLGAMAAEARGKGA